MFPFLINAGIAWLNSFPEEGRVKTRNDTNLSQHLHDGGIAVDILASPTQPVCTTRLNYAESPGFIFKGTMMMNDDKPAVDHISSLERCQIGQIKEMKRDQRWIVKGRYNFDERQGNIEEGKQGAVSVSFPCISLYTLSLVSR